MVGIKLLRRRPLRCAAAPMFKESISETGFLSPSMVRFPGRNSAISNSDGVKDAGEPGLEDWIVYIDANGNGVRDLATNPITIAATGLAETDRRFLDRQFASDVQWPRHRVQHRSYARYHPQLRGRLGCVPDQPLGQAGRTVYRGRRTVQRLEQPYAERLRRHARSLHWASTTCRIRALGVRRVCSAILTAKMRRAFGRCKFAIRRFADRRHAQQLVAEDRGGRGVPDDRCRRQLHVRRSAGRAIHNSRRAKTRLDANSARDDEHPRCNWVEFAVDRGVVAVDDPNDSNGPDSHRNVKNVNFGNHGSQPLAGDFDRSGTRRYWRLHSVAENAGHQRGSNFRRRRWRWRWRCRCGRSRRVARALSASRCPPVQAASWFWPRRRSSVPASASALAFAWR